MSTTNIQVLHDLAETSLATYAYFNPNERTDSALAAALQDNNFGASFTPDQTTTFVAKYKLLSTQPNVETNGFSGTVFQEKQSGVKVLALRGTEFTQTFGQILTDGLVADGLGIGGSGYANLQGLEMCLYWKRLNTAGGQAVSYTDTELLKLYALKLGPVAGLAAVTTPLSVLASVGFVAFANGLKSDLGIESGIVGQPVIAPGEKVNVTGHSLGGHLAQLFSRIFPDSVAEVVTLNAPTFFSQGDVFLNLLGYTSTKGGQTTRVEADGDGIHVLGNVSFGSVVGIAQENSPGPIAAISGNHSSINGVDSLHVMSVLAKLDTSHTNDSAYFSNLIRGSANTADPSYERLVDALRKALAGPGIEPLPIGDGGNLSARTTLYATLTALQANPIFNELAGKLSIRQSSSQLSTLARSDFGAFIALQDLSPIYISGTTADARDKLAELWQAGRAADYAAWQADKSSGKPVAFTDNWIADRAAMLGVLVERNNKDIGSSLLLQGQQNIDYWDSNSGQTLSVRNGVTNSGTVIKKVSFGGDGADSLSGQGGTDRLYGGASDDSIDGKGGDDYLEGGSGTDTYTFTGQFGKDMIVDSDGKGSLTFGGQTLSGGKYQGLEVWVQKLSNGDTILFEVKTSSASATNKQLFIHKQGDLVNTITINNFDLAKATNTGGYLGITLDNSVKVAINDQPGVNYWASHSDTSSLTGKGSDEVEGGGEALAISLSAGAKEGDTITLAIATNPDNFDVILGNSRVPANGAVITLTEGQTDVRISLVQTGDITADLHASISATYTSVDSQANPPTTSNSWGINVKDGGDPSHTFIGDQRGKLVGNAGVNEVAMHLIAACAYSTRSRGRFFLKLPCNPSTHRSHGHAAIPTRSRSNLST